MERVSELIDQAGEMFSTLEPEIANSIIAMGVSLAFVVLPVLILFFMFVRSLALGIKNELMKSRGKIIKEINQVYARTVPEIKVNESTDTQPLFIIQEVPQIVMKKARPTEPVSTGQDFRISPERFNK